MIVTILLVFAFVLFSIATWRPTHPDASRLVYLAFALCTLAALAGRLPWR